MIRAHIVPALLLCSLAAPLTAQDTTSTARSSWEFSLQGYWYFLPEEFGESDFPLLIGYADRGKWHLEARYNYEELDTFTFFVGRNFSFGEKLTVDVTPMLGAFVGHLDGIAPGLELTFTLGKFELYSEGEYVWDLRDYENNYFYLWTEFSWHATDWLRLGLVGQRTRAYHTSLDIQRGLVAETTIGRARLGAWWFNPGSEGFVSIGVGFDF